MRVAEFWWHEDHVLAIIEPGHTKFAALRRPVLLLSPPPPMSNLLGQRVPNGVAVRDEFEKLDVERLLERLGKVAGIRMG